MSALRQPQTIFSPEEYLARERAAMEKSDYLNGVIVAMAGGTFAHEIIKTNIVRHLGNQLAARPCVALSSDMKLRIDRANLFRYPDASAVCGPMQFHDSTQDAYCNPSLIVEVSSSSTERYDRTEKFALYRFIESFVEYLIVAQDRMEAELSRRQPDGQWIAEVFTGAEDVIALESLGCTLRLADLYDKVPLGSA